MDSLPAPYQQPGWRRYPAGDGAHGEPAGVIALKPLSPLRSVSPDERACEMKRLWVRPQFRGLRLGKLLSERLIDEARSRGYTAIYLDTMPATMQAANHIYAELAFSPVERYGDNPVLRTLPGSEDNTSPDVVFFRREI